MHERPIARPGRRVAQLGARDRYLGQEGYPPLAIHPAAIRAGGGVSVRGNVSSQFLTGLLIALPLTGAQDGRERRRRARSRSRTSRSRSTRCAASASRSSATDWSAFTVPAGARYASPGEIYVEGDASSASYFLAAGAISGLQGGGPVRVEGVGRASIQGDVRFDRGAGAHGRGDRDGRELDRGGRRPARPPRRGRLQAIDADFNHIPDAAMTAAVAALFADGHEHAAQHRQLARQGNRPHRRHGDRAAQARRRGGGGRRLPPHHAASRLTPHASRRDRHLRRPSHGDVFLARGARRRAGAHQRSAVRGARRFPSTSTCSRRISRMTHEHGDAIRPVIAIDGPSASGKGTVAQAVARRARLSLPQQRRALPGGRARRRCEPGVEPRRRAGARG